MVLVVSALVAEHPSLKHRSDLAYPGLPIFDGEGRIEACNGLCAGPGLADYLDRWRKKVSEEFDRSGTVEGVEATTEPPDDAELNHRVAAAEDLIDGLRADQEAASKPEPEPSAA